MKKATIFILIAAFAGLVLTGCESTKEKVKAFDEWFQEHLW